jgi:hypothetical protein
VGARKETRRTFALAVIRSVLDGALTREEIARIPHSSGNPRDEIRRRIYAIVGLILKESAGLIDENLFLQDYPAQILKKAIGDEYPMYDVTDILRSVDLIVLYRSGTPGVPKVVAPRNIMLGCSVPAAISHVARLNVPLDELGLSERFRSDPLPQSDPSVTALVEKIARKGSSAIDQAIRELRTAKKPRSKGE